MANKLLTLGTVLTYLIINLCIFQCYVGNAHKFHCQFDRLYENTNRANHPADKPD